jgi:hypothetical protein
VLPRGVRVEGRNERGFEDQSGLLSGHLLLEAALVEGFAYGAGATTVALEGYQAGATLFSQMSVVGCRRRGPGVAYEEGSSSDSETEGESSSHCEICVCCNVCMGLKAMMGVEKFGGSSSRSSVSRSRLPVRRRSWHSPQKLNPSQRSFAQTERKKNSRVVAPSLPSRHLT